MPEQPEMFRVTRQRAGLVGVGVFLVASLGACDALTELVEPDDEGGAYGQIEVYSRTSTSWTDQIPNKVDLTEPASSGSGSGIGAAASNPDAGVAVVVANVDPDSPCATVGRTCAPTQGASTIVSLTLVTPGGEIGQWVAVDGEVTVESLSPTRFRLDNVQMRVAPYSGNPANGTFNIRGVVGADG